MSDKPEISNQNADFYNDLMEWDDDKTAFIKHDVYDGHPVWMVCAANGERIAATDDRDFAFIVARQNDLEPCSVH